ncbi:uncharacterized protein LOC141655934 [Silene latifolia]|uniref:uncharacterized protein LOC141655934 n=1 Tax=Silene latifolia TaxID=37657 RepID=UPI003D76D97B
MKEAQTPRKNLSHGRSKDSPSIKSSISVNSKKNHNIAKKSLNAEFSSLPEDVITDSVTESFNFSPVSETLSDNNINAESIDTFECFFAGEEGLTSSDSSASSKITTVNDDIPINSHSHGRVIISEGNVEADVVANLLKQAKVEILSSNDVSPGSKKLLDSLIEVSVKEFCALPEEKDPVTVLISEKTRVLVFCLAVWLITMMILLIVFSRLHGRDTSSFYLPPT